jgi:hypothetical protein
MTGKNSHCTRPANQPICLKTKYWQKTLSTAQLSTANWLPQRWNDFLQQPGFNFRFHFLE